MNDFETGKMLLKEFGRDEAIATAVGLAARHDDEINKLKERIKKLERGKG